MIQPDGTLIGIVALNTPTGNCVLHNGHLYITAGVWNPCVCVFRRSHRSHRRVCACVCVCVCVCV